MPLYKTKRMCLCAWIRQDSGLIGIFHASSCACDPPTAEAIARSYNSCPSFGRSNRCGSAVLTACRPSDRAKELHIHLTMYPLQFAFVPQLKGAAHVEGLRDTSLTSQHFVCQTKCVSCHNRRNNRVVDRYTAYKLVDNGIPVDQIKRIKDL